MVQTVKPMYTATEASPAAVAASPAEARAPEPTLAVAVPIEAVAPVPIEAAVAAPALQPAPAPAAVAPPAAARVPVEATVHFGLGGATQVDEVTVVWPGGQRETFGSFEADRTVTLRRGTGGARAAVAKPSR